MAQILLGILSSSVPSGFRATGGTFTVDANGYRHHIFNSSANLSISAPETKDVYILLQDGGKTPTGGDAPNRIAQAGGNSGEVRYLSGTANSDIFVTVGGAGSPSGVSGISTSTWNSPNTASGGVGMVFSIDGPVTTQPQSGSNGVLHSSISSIYNSLPYLPSFSGGGGGGGSFRFETITAGGTYGGGAGGYGAAGQTNGVNAKENSGGGGGGWGGRTAGAFRPDGTQYFFVYQQGTSGLGGSGYAVISYAID
jgi:hypothetical protein